MFTTHPTIWNMLTTRPHARNPSPSSFGYIKPLHHHQDEDLSACLSRPPRFMATVEHSSTLPATDLRRRVPVANPDLPVPSIGHGPVTLPSSLPPPIQSRDGTLQSSIGHGSVPSLPAYLLQFGLATVIPKILNPRASSFLKPRVVPKCLLSNVERFPLSSCGRGVPGCPGGTSPSQPIRHRDVPICPLTNPQCHGGTFPPSQPIRRRDGTPHFPDEIFNGLTCDFVLPIS